MFKTELAHSSSTVFVLKINKAQILSKRNKSFCWDICLNPRNPRGSSLPDSYIILEVNNKKYISKVVNNSLQPHWHFSIRLPKNLYTKISISILDNDSPNMNKFPKFDVIGKVETSLHSLQKGLKPFGNLLSIDVSLIKKTIKIPNRVFKQQRRQRIFRGNRPPTSGVTYATANGRIPPPKYPLLRFIPFFGKGASGYKVLQISIPKGAVIQKESNGDLRLWALMDGTNCNLFGNLACNAGWGRVEKPEFSKGGNGETIIKVQFLSNADKARSIRLQAEYIPK